LKTVALFLLIFLFAAGSAARADASDDRVFAEMMERLQRSSVLRVSFRQERLLRVLGRPLISHGSVLIVAERGVLWQVEDPYEAIFRIRPGDIVEWEGDDHPRPVRIATNPIFHFMIEMLLGLLTGDPSGLREGFDAEALPNDDGWSLRLTPQAGDLSGIIASIEISGDRFIEEVRIEDAKGDAVNFTFNDFQVQGTVLNATVQAYFAE
jgi:hypothetical protein